MLFVSLCLEEVTFMGIYTSNFSNEENVYNEQTNSICKKKRKRGREKKKRNLICNMTLRRTTLISNQIIETN